MRERQALLTAAIEDSGIALVPCECGRGSSRHVIDEFFATLDSDPGRLLGQGWMDGHAVNSSFRYRSAPAVAEILMAALPFYVTGLRREVLLESLLDLSGGDTDDLVESCQDMIRPGVWTFLEEIASGRSAGSASYAFDIILALDEDDWVQFAREQLADFLPAVQLDPDYA
ncbi:hypothetical protein [Streptomyces sp. NPDC056463]|uniref:hypothetical protein n=1 Tax=unclassified Streptomyces TaxID=2593676 RepID=UPI0036BCB303